jgi:hypothetical protein
VSEQAPAIAGIAALAVDFLRDPEGNEFCLLRPRR